ncbi:hypothetical protein ACHQM5_014404 [Ranunculus cassubicifolius]
MAGSPSDDCGVGGSSNGISSGQRSQSSEALSEWRSSEQVENGTPSTSPPYWDTDDDDDDCGPKPSELYGKFTWKIEKFSTISKRELRSNAFEVGGYKWYILIYPQGCDVCNHLSLFLCVANHDKLLPGWSHFAQFTIAVVNKDPKKSKYSDTLHRFWKKEHDWGWKKFMELSKVMDGFVVNDTLVIKAQVQVIREKLDRPFRCLDCQYRRELVRVYLTNVEQICRRFVEEKRGKLEKLIADEARWSSFSTFWREFDKKSIHKMVTEKTDVILKVVVKHFFIEKEVTSTLVMDSLYSGLKALECQSKSKKGGGKSSDSEDTPDPIVCVENDMFVLTGDLLGLLKRAALEPLPPKDEKGPQNRTKDGNSGEDFNKDSIERDERRLTELGRRSVEIFVLAHIFSKIEVAHQEDVALKKQEELIREEEESWQAGNDQKSKRGASDKEKRAKKKQSKQKRSSRKSKDTKKEEKFDVEVNHKKRNDGSVDIRTINDFSVKQVLTMLEKSETLDDVSDVSFNGDDIIEAIPPDVEDRASPLNSDTDTSDILHHIDTVEEEVRPTPIDDSSSSGVCGLPVQNGKKKAASSVIDDSSSTCSTDSVPSVTLNNGSYKSHHSLPNSYNSQMSSPTRGKKQHGKGRRDRNSSGSSAPDLDNRLSEPVMDIARLRDASGTCRATETESEVPNVIATNHHTVHKEEVVPQPKKMAEVLSTASSPSRNLQSIAESNSTTQIHQETEKRVPPTQNTPLPQAPVVSSQRSANILPTFTPSEKPTIPTVSGVSRPSSTPLIPAPRQPTLPTVSTAQTTPLLSRSVSATGRLGIDSSTTTTTNSYAPPSYRNAIMGKTMSATSSNFSPRPAASPVSSPSSLPFSSQPSSSSSQGSGPVRSGFTFGSVTPEILQSRPQWLEYPQHNPTSFPNHLEFYGSTTRSRGPGSGPGPRAAPFYPDELPPTVSGSADEFPHLDIINYLLDEEGYTAHGQGQDYSRHHAYNRQFSLPLSTDTGPSSYPRYDPMENYYGSAYNSPMAGPSHGVYGNGHLVDGVGGTHQNQWLYGVGGTPDISMLNIRSNDYDGGYSYQLPDYSNLVSGGVNGYNTSTASFHPSNGR